MNTAPCSAGQVLIADIPVVETVVQSTFAARCRKAAEAVDTAAYFELRSPVGSSLEL